MCLGVPRFVMSCWPRHRSTRGSLLPDDLRAVGECRRPAGARQLLLAACIAVLCCTAALAAKKAKKEAASVGADGEAGAVSDVLVVTEDNFDAEFKKGPMLLEFYAPVRTGRAVCIVWDPRLMTLLRGPVACTRSLSRLLGAGW